MLKNETELKLARLRELILKRCIEKSHHTADQVMDMLTSDTTMKGDVVRATYEIEIKTGNVDGQERVPIDINDLLRCKF